MRSFIASSVVLALAAFSSVSQAAPLAQVDTAARIPSQPPTPARPTPQPPAVSPPRGGSPLKFFGCDISKLGPDFPKGQTQVVAPTGSKAKFVGLGVGVQNYTCSDAGTYASAGAVAQLYDVSCVASTPLFKALPGMAFALSSRSSAISTIAKQIGSTPLKLGDHYFIPAASGTGISPKFDFTASQKSASAFATVAKAGGTPSPQGAANVDWLALNTVDGSLAKTVFRVDTKAGQPPESCTPGSALISVPYAAMYWFYA